MSNIDFEEQLQYEKEEKNKQEGDCDTQYDPYIHIDPNDGTIYEWNPQKQAWFPKIDETFLAAYHAYYGSSEVDSTTADNSGTSADSGVPSSKPAGSTAADDDNDRKPAEKRKATNEPGWFNVDDEHNTNVYVSGLSSDITEAEFCELMSKCGLVMKDPATNEMKVKLYKTADGALKGDGLCCYIRVESVNLALNILDGSLYKGKELHVERAKFQMKGAYDPSKKPRKKKPKEKEKLKKKLEKLLDWRPDKLRGMRGRNEKTVIIKNMFDPKEFEEDAALILEYQKDLREEGAKCGEVKKVVVYDRHPEGIASITFKEPEEADECISLMNGRWFASRRLVAETWDGKTKYKSQESEAEEQARIAQWNRFLGGDDKEQSRAPDASSSVDAASSANKVKMDSVRNSESADLPVSSSDIKQSTVLAGANSSCEGGEQDSDVTSTIVDKGRDSKNEGSSSDSDDLDEKDRHWP